MWNEEQKYENKKMDFPGRNAIQLRIGKFLPTIEGTIDKLSADF